MGQSSGPGRVNNFLLSITSKPAVGSPSLLSKGYPGINRPGREAHDSLPTSTKVEKTWIYTSTPPIPSSRGMSLKYRLDRRWGGPHSRSGRYGKAKILNPSIVQPVASPYTDWATATQQTTGNVYCDAFCASRTALHSDQGHCTRYN
jgi:hypothetical protein